jgi:hypothetical protein
MLAFPVAVAQCKGVSPSRLRASSARRIAVVEDHPGAAEEFVAACCAAGCPAPSEVTPSTIEWRGRRGCSSSWRTPRDDLHDDYL